MTLTRYWDFDDRPLDAWQANCAQLLMALRLVKGNT